VETSQVIEVLENLKHIDTMYKGDSRSDYTQKALDIAIEAVNTRTPQIERTDSETH